MLKLRVTSAAAALAVSEASLVILSALLAPVSLLSAIVGVAMVVSSVKVRLALAVLPAVSVSVTTTVWLPSAAGAVYVAEAGPPSMLKLRVTSAAAALTLSAASLVILSALLAPVSLLSAIVGV